MPATPVRRDRGAMIRADEEFWDYERASFDDELDAWRERTAGGVADGQRADPTASRRRTRRIGARARELPRFGQNESARIGRRGSRSQPPTERPSTGKAARSMARCAPRRRRFVGPSATITQIDTLGGGSRGPSQPRSVAIRIA